MKTTDHQLISIKELPYEIKNCKGIIAFANDIYLNPQLCYEFNKDPLSVLMNYGITDYNADSMEVQAILSLGDEEIVKSLNNNNFNDFLKALNKNEYLQSSFIQAISNNVEFSKLNTLFIVPIAIYAVAIVLAAIIAELALFVHLGVKFWPKKVTLEILDDVAIRLFIDKTKNINQLYIDNDSLIKEIKDAISSIDLLSDEQKNEAFQIACGTIENIQDDVNEKRPS